MTFMKYHSKEDYDRLAVQLPKSELDAYRLSAERLILSFESPFQCPFENYKVKRVSENSDKILSAAEKKLLKEKERLLKAFVTLPEDSRKIVLKLVEDFASKIS